MHLQKILRVGIVGVLLMLVLLSSVLAQGDAKDLAVRKEAKIDVRERADSSGRGPSPVDMRMRHEVKRDGEVRVGQEERVRVRKTALDRLSDEQKKRLRVDVRAKLRNIDAAHADTLSKLSDEELERLAKVDPVVRKRLLERSEEEIRQTLAKAKVVRVKREELFRARTIAKERVEKARSRIKALEDALKRASKRAREGRQAFEEAKERLKKCEGVQTKECEDLRQEILQKAKDWLSVTIERVSAHLDKVAEHVEQNDQLTDEQAQDILADVDAARKVLEEIAADVEAAQTKQDIKNAAKRLEKVWKRVRTREVLHAARVEYIMTGRVIERAEHLVERLDAFLLKLEEQGVDTTLVEDDVAKIHELVDDALALHEEAKDLFRQAIDNNDKEALELAKKNERAAHENLKAAQKILRDVLKTLREQGQAFREDEVVEVVVPAFPDEGGVESDDDLDVEEEPLEDELEEEVEVEVEDSVEDELEDKAEVEVEDSVEDERGDDNSTSEETGDDAGKDDDEDASDVVAEDDSSGSGSNASDDGLDEVEDGQNVDDEKDSSGKGSGDDKDSEVSQ